MTATTGRPKGALPPDALVLAGASVRTVLLYVSLLPGEPLGSWALAYANPARSPGLFAALGLRPNMLLADHTILRRPARQAASRLPGLNGGN